MSDGGRTLMATLGALGGVALVVVALALWSRSPEIAWRMSDHRLAVWAVRAAAVTLGLAGQALFFGLAVPSVFPPGRLDRGGLLASLAGAVILAVASGVLMARAW